MPEVTLRVALLFALGCAGDPDGVTQPGTDSGTPPDPGDVWDDQHVIVVPETGGLRLLARDGTFRATWTWAELAGGTCDGCTGEGGAPDGDGILFSWSIGNLPGQGGIGRLGPNGPEWSLEPLSFPHDAIRDPFDGSILVPESTASRVIWVDGDGASGAPLRTLGNMHPDWDQDIPNGAEHLSFGGREYVLLSSRGSSVSGGRIGLWDITDPDQPVSVWRFPASEEGLKVPHGPVLRERDGQWWLLYAHTNSLPGAGSIGLAVTADPTVLPEYVADLAPTTNGPLGFVRGVELTDDGELVITDSGELDGPETGSFSGRVLRATWPEGLTPSGLAGGGDALSVVDLDGMELVVDGLGQPFEGWLWEPTFTLP